jgi:hypothetical protein
MHHPLCLPSSFALLPSPVLLPLQKYTLLIVAVLVISAHASLDLAHLTADIDDLSVDMVPSVSAVRGSPDSSSS